jgi:hypothetical protein
MNTAFQISLEKGRRPDEAGASWMGSDRTSRRIEGCLKMGHQTIKVRGEKVLPQKNFSPVFSSSDAAKAEFSTVISNSSTGILAKITDGSKDTVKCWRVRRAFPGGENLLNLAAEGGDPAVRQWVARKLGFIDPAMMDAMLAAQRGGK